MISTDFKIWNFRISWKLFWKESSHYVVSKAILSNNLKIGFSSKWPTNRKITKIYFTKEIQNSYILTIYMYLNIHNYFKNLKYIIYYFLKYTFLNSIFYNFFCLGIKKIILKSENYYWNFFEILVFIFKILNHTPKISSLKYWLVNSKGKMSIYPLIKHI